ncbi:MAG: hypothetical protein QXG86_00835 [Candidatus Woesearchaeota archaeon]
MKSEKIIKKKKKENYNIIKYLPVVGASIFIIIGLVFLFLKPYTMGIYSFEGAVVKVSKIDSKYNVSFSDYSRGLEYLYSHPPRDPLNSREIDPIIEEYSKISGDEATNLFIDFRKNLLLADKYYKLSQKTYRADLHKYGIKCSNAPYIFESINNQNISAHVLNKSVSSLLLLKERYPEKFEKLNISESWINLYKNIPIDFEAEIKYKIDLFNSFCANKTTN